MKGKRKRKKRKKEKNPIGKRRKKLGNEEGTIRENKKEITFYFYVILIRMISRNNRKIFSYLIGIFFLSFFDEAKREKREKKKVKNKTRTLQCRKREGKEDKNEKVVNE